MQALLFYITRVMQSGQAAVNQQYGQSATVKQETEPEGTTLTSKPSACPEGR